MRARHAASPVELAEGGREHHRDLPLAVLDEAHRDREEGVAVRKIGRAVDGVDVPDRALGAALPLLLGDHPVVREREVELLADEAFGAQIVLGDEVDIALLLDVERARLRGEQRLDQSLGDLTRHVERAAHLFGVHRTYIASRRRRCRVESTASR